MKELKTNQTSTQQECEPCQDLLSRLDADLREFGEEIAAARAKRIKIVAVVLVFLLLAFLGGVAWWLFA